VSEQPHLGEAALLILVGLGPSERHGYSIMREVETLSAGRSRLAPGTLYTNIKRLLAAGLIEEADERPDPGLDDGRRRYYRLTDNGQQALAAEIDRMEALVARARPRAPGGATAIAEPGSRLGFARLEPEPVW
jgi:DNA-binding PadR family transcriptional regulator